MSKRQLPRTMANFPRMKDRAYARREGPVVSWGGGMWCPCGRRITWGAVRRAEYDQIEQDIADHEACCDEGIGDDYDDDPLDAALNDLEGHALVEAIHERKRFAVGIDPGAPESTIVFDRATGRIVDVD